MRSLDLRRCPRSGVLVLATSMVACAGAPRATAGLGAALVSRSCDEPIALLPGLPMRANTRLGRDQLRASCVRSSAPECLFAVEVGTRSELRLSLESSDFDGALALFEASSAAPRELRCVDDAPSGDVHHARLQLALAPGRYLVAVDGANGEAGEFELFGELEPLPTVAEACMRAAPLVPGLGLRESTRGGADLFSATCGGGAQGPEHVHKLVIDTPSRVRIRQQAEYDGSLYLRAQCEDASSELACNDDFQSSARSAIAARLEPGIYYVFSDSYSREHSGDYVLALERVEEPAAKPVAAICAELQRALPLAAGQHELDTLAGSSAFAGSCGGQGAPELVFSLRVDHPSTLIAVLEQSELNAVMYLRRACSDPGSELSCHVAPRIDRSPGESESSPAALVASLERGSYVLVIDGYEPNDIGAATLRLALTSK